MRLHCKTEEGNRKSEKQRQQNKKQRQQQQQTIANAQRNESKNSIFPSLRFNILNYLLLSKKRAFRLCLSLSHALLQAHAHIIHTSLYVYLCVTNDTSSKFSGFCRLNKIAGKWLIKIRQFDTIVRRI